MLYAVMLLNAKNGKAFEVKAALEKFPYIGLKVHIFEIFDFVIVIEAETPQELAKRMIDEVEHIEGIESTLKMVVAEDEIVPINWLKNQE